jgi:hypothetical protein
MIIPTYDYLDTDRIIRVDRTPVIEAVELKMSLLLTGVVHIAYIFKQELDRWRSPKWNLMEASKCLVELMMS